jgi:hypothetical protein
MAASREFRNHFILDILPNSRRKRVATSVSSGGKQYSDKPKEQKAGCVPTFKQLG